MYEQRIKQVRQLVASRKVDALLLTHLPMIRWAVGFSGSSGMLYVDANRVLFATDTRYKTQAAQEVTADEIVMAIQAKLAPPLADRTNESIKRIGFDSEHLTIAELKEFQKLWPTQELVGLEGLLQHEMAVKSLEELDLIKQAQAITDKTFSEIINILKSGMTEKDVAAEIVYRQLKNGADQIPEHFWPIVASGPNSAIVHAHPTNRKLADGDVVLLDFGCIVNGYTSDMTRTVVLGKASKKVAAVYSVVLQAQLAACAGAKAGIRGRDLDAMARTMVESAGYEIPHTLGHSLGLEIHQEPRISPRNPDPLPEGAVMTIEPGIYIPGEFGIRIEDMVLLQKGGNQNLTTSPKALIEVHSRR